MIGRRRGMIHRGGSHSFGNGNLVWIVEWRCLDDTRNV
jgi:hypothetical protein